MGSLHERVLDVFEAMQRQGVVSNVMTYTALISTFDKGQQPERAFDMFLSM